MQSYKLMCKSQPFPQQIVLEWTPNYFFRFLNLQNKSALRFSTAILSDLKNIVLFLNDGREGGVRRKVS